MPRDVNGNTQPLPGTIVSTGDTILPSQHNPMVNDVYAMIGQSLSRDGQGGMRAPLDMSGFRVENVGTAVSDTDGVSLGQSRINGVPVGTILSYAGTNAPETWAQCYGQAISRTTFSDLFTVIGTTYGAGDGATTFNLPDLRGRVVAGKDNMGGISADRLTSPVNGDILGSAGGVESQTLTIAQLPPHNHGGVTTVNGSHTHQTAGAMATGGSSSISVWGSGNRNDSSNSTLAAGDHQHSIPYDGSGSGHNNVQPTIIMNKIIKVSY